METDYKSRRHAILYYLRAKREISSGENLLQASWSWDGLFPILKLVNISEKLIHFESCLRELLFVGIDVCVADLNFNEGMGYWWTTLKSIHESMMRDVPRKKDDIRSEAEKKASEPHTTLKPESV